MTALSGAALAIALLYAALLALVWWQQERLNFLPSKLPAEHRFDSLLSRILHETIAAVQAQGGCLYLEQEKSMVAVQASWRQQALPAGQVPWQEALFGKLAQTERLTLPIVEQYVCLRHALVQEGARRGTPAFE